MQTIQKKIVFAISSLAVGGAERVVVNLINCLDRNKFEVLLVIFEDKRDLQKDLHFNVNIVCLNKKSRWDFLKMIFKLRKIICHYKPDTVISFLQYTNIIIVLSSLFFYRKYKIILSERNYARSYLKKARFGFLKRLLMYFTYKRADRIIAVSHAIKKALKEDLHINTQMIKAIYNPVPLDEIKNQSQMDVEHPFFDDKNASIFMGCGRLVEQKRFDKLLKAFSLVRERKKSARLIILGEGRLKRKLEDLASQLNINDFVSFVGYKHNPYVWLAKADIYVLSSDYEGFPNVLLEAMACGTPIISTDCPSGPNEIITHGKNGYLVPLTGKEEGLAKAMLTLLKDEDLRKRFSREGIKRSQDFRVEKIFPQYERIL